MPLNFLSSSSSPFDEIIERATAETLPCENWDLIISINDKVNEGGSKGAKDCLLSLKKRLNHRDPHVVLLALSVVDSCMCNCGRVFQQEVCSKEFINELKSKATGSNSNIAEKARSAIQKWVDEFKGESFISPMAALYNDLKKEGYEFTTSDNKKSKTSHIAALENALREEEELNKAIQMSLEEQSTKTSTSSFSNLYPTSSGGSGGGFSSSSTTTKPTASSGRLVKALYDFEAAEDNELTFKAGDVITITDDSDINWWRGSIGRNEGLFPASFVSADLNIDVEQMNAMEKKRSVQFDENVTVETFESKSSDKEAPKIDAEKMNRCLEILQNADPTGERPDPPELVELEEQCISMAPLIDTELANYDRQINQLSDVNSKLMDALNLYHTTMSDASNLSTMTMPYMPAPPQHPVNQMPVGQQFVYQAFPGQQTAGAQQVSYTGPSATNQQNV